MFDIPQEVAARCVGWGFTALGILAVIVAHIKRVPTTSLKHIALAQAFMAICLSGVAFDSGKPSLGVFIAILGIGGMIVSLSFNHFYRSVHRIVVLFCSMVVTSFGVSVLISV